MIHRILSKPKASKMLTQLTFCVVILFSGDAFAQNISPQNLFVLAPAEKTLFTPPASYVVDFQGCWAAKQVLWNAFNTNSKPAPLDPGPNGCAPDKAFTDPDAAGSQNIPLVWVGASALSYAMNGDVAMYEKSAQKAIQLLELTKLQTHMRHEGIGGYINIWQGPIAGMALAGFYAPVGSTSGPKLLALAREWWADHIAILRELRTPDGQLLLVGSRMNHGDVGDSDEENISPAVNLQLIDPQPHNTLHPYIAALITADGKPSYGLGSPYHEQWHKHLDVYVRWIVLRAFQSGALLRVPANHSLPAINREVYRWTASGRTYVATPAAVGYPRCRFKTSWAPGEWIRIDVVHPYGFNGGKNLPGGHLPPQPLNIPGTANHVLGPARTIAHPACAQNGTCSNDAEVIAIPEPFLNGCEKTIVPRVVIKNTGVNTITELSLYYQVDGLVLYSDISKGALSSKTFVLAQGIPPGATRTLSLNAVTAAAGSHTLKVWVKDVNKITDRNASNDLDSIQFEVVNAGKPTTYSRNFENITAGAIPNDWTLYNPDAKEQWFVHSNGTNKALAFNNYAYTGAVNAKDEVLMPVIDLTAAGPIYLSFDVSHAEKHAATSPDKLRVLVSTDCGQTFTQIWKKEGAALSTVPDNANLFIPSGSQDYRNEQVDLSTYTGNNKVIIKFENTSNNGNSTLIDNVKFVTSPATSVQEYNPDFLMNVFPVPAKDVLTVEYFISEFAALNCELINTLGQVVYSENFGMHSAGRIVKSIDVSGFDAGIYQLRLSSGNSFLNRKIILTNR